MTACDAITVATVASTTAGMSQADGEQAEEWIVERRRVAHQERPLPHVVQRQRGQDHAGPGELDGPFAEVAQVGVQRFRPGEGQDDGAQRPRTCASPVSS